jgi:uncharacterized membrane protein
MFAGSGVTHFVRPGVFTPIVPRWLPSPLGVVYASGAAELVCAAGLVAGRRWAAPASAALLVAVLPARTYEWLWMPRRRSTGRLPGRPAGR